MLKAYLKIIRIQNIAIVGISMLLGGLCLGIKPAPLEWVMGILSLGLLTAAGNIQNDILDIDTDTAEGKNRPLVSGDISLKSAQRLMYICYALGMVLPAFLKWECWVLSLMVMLLLCLYNYRLKNTVFLGNFTVALLCSLAVWYYEWPQLPNATLYPFVFAFLATLMREIIKDAEDRKGDLATGITTLAIQLGPSKTRKVSLMLWGFLLILFPFPYLHQGYHWSYIALLSVLGLLPMAKIFLALLPEQPNWTHAQKLLKLYMLAGVIALGAGKILGNAA